MKNLGVAYQASLQESLEALRRDLIHETGPQISTMRNYRYAIVQYNPEDEFKLRSEVQKLNSELVASGWAVLSIDLNHLLMERIRSKGPQWIERIIATEERLSQVAPERGLNYLKGHIEALIEGPDGIAIDCSRIITEYVEAYPDRVERTLALVARAGALYPFFRASTLLKYLDGHTHNVPVVLLYPGERHGPTGLKFMGLLEPDNDYRPRIYP